MQKRETVEIFRQRLTELIEKSGGSQARFAAKAGLDRSTLSQLLSEANLRLPRAETIARIASRHGTSVDWLLGLSQHPAVAADVVPQTMVEAGADDPYNEALKRWFAEVKGSKIRYVPSSLPDQVKTEAVIHHENFRLSREAAEMMGQSAQSRIDHARSGDSEIEVCSTRQSLEEFARGEGKWRNLPLRERRRQLEHMARMVDELYPSYRWFLFDARQLYSAPYTIFGAKRAAIYMGSMYFVFTATESIRELTHHFENLIRQCTVQPNETAPFIRRLQKDTDDRLASDV
jgi:transcriptional regulator with XRE-family HTH domain